MAQEEENDQTLIENLAWIVREYRERVVKNEGDPEVAHGEEDDLAMEVILHCVEHCDVARVFLEEREKNHRENQPERWYA